MAIALLESAERAPSAPPTAEEERAARVLAEHRCRAEDRGQCGLQRYAVGTVDARARRFNRAKESFMWACDAHASWCARAVQEPVDWTPEEFRRHQGVPAGTFCIMCGRWRRAAYRNVGN